jgi:hypothetical protein
VNIDLDPIKITGFKFARPDDVSLCCAISDSGQHSVSVYSFGYYTLIQTILKERAEKAAAQEGKRMIEHSVPCMTLTQALDGTRFRGRQIDYLTVDCEGHDLNVLRSLDWNVYRPRLITVEVNGSLEDILNSDIYRILTGKSYTLYAWTPPSLHFEGTV